MFLEYLKIFFRQLYRNPLNSIISIISLAFGITCTVLMLLFINYELGYDKFHINKNEIYRVSMRSISKDREDVGAGITAAVGPSLESSFPEIVHSVRIRNPQAGSLIYKDNSIYDNNIRYVDSSFFQVFSFRLIKGNPATVLASPYSIVLTETIASKLFGEKDPLGQMISLNNKDVFMVTGICETPPSNSHIQFSSLISFISLYEDSRLHLGWDGGWQYPTYIQLNPEASIANLDAKMPAFMYEKINKKYEAFGARLEPVFEPLTDIYLNSQAEDSNDPGGSVASILIFSSVSLFILLLACINFINLTTAQGISRAREVGIRKTFGAKRRTLIRQFINESMIMSIVAFLLALLLIEFLLPQLNSLINKNLILFTRSNLIIILGFPLIIILVGLLSGSYPAFYLSAFKPLAVIHGKINSGSGKQRIRNILVLFQFFISVVLIIFTMALIKQVHFMTRKDMGFPKDEILILDLVSEKARDNFALIKQELKSIPGILSVSASSNYPGRGLTSNGYLPEGQENPVMIHVLDVDYDFIQTYDLKINSGRGFNKDFGNDENAYLVNQALTKEMAWDDAVGKNISRDGLHEVIGEVANFHFAPMQQSVRPLIFTMKPYIGYNILNIRYNSSDLKAMLTLIENKWKGVLPEEPFLYSFLSDDLSLIYEEEMKTSSLLLFLTVMAILIAGMGLFGLASFTTRQRTKEIGIRKSLGASSFSILTSLGLSFTLWVFIANILAWPVAFYLISGFLKDYAYKIQMPYLLFILTTLATFLLAWITIGHQTYKASITNPVKALRHE
ncbi:MAG: FtsX-like permease family protein [Bacteroidota bacterium]|nr:FtsX-like permease family protein [Bacteroidota bacterium]